MYELIQAGECSFYLDCPAKIGIWTADGRQVYLIDSGNDKDAGKKILKILKEQGWELKGIINTHSNADHIGGNQYLQKQTGCRIYANGIEASFTRYPVLEPSFLYGGYPCKDLRHKFLMAGESQVLDYEDESFPKELEVISLPGHFFHMTGIRTPDQTVFLADCLSSETTLSKYGITFLYDVEQYLKTLDLVSGLKASLFVPSHAPAVTDIRELCRINKEKVLEIAETLTSFCQAPKTFEEVLKSTFDTYGLTMNFEQYVLVGSTVRSYLSWLKDQGKVKAAFVDNRLLWEAA